MLTQAPKGRPSNFADTREPRPREEQKEAQDFVGLKPRSRLCPVPYAV